MGRVVIACLLLSLPISRASAQGAVLRLTTRAADRIDVTLGVPKSEPMPLCTAPCEAALAPGRYLLGIASARGASVIDLVLAAGTTTVALEFESRRDDRLAGWILVAAGLIAASASSMAIALGARDEPDRGVASIAALAGVVLAGIGVALALWDDHRRAAIEPEEATR